MRVLIFHGYLLRGTGSNVYNANLAAALVGLGHEVHLLCQEPAPEEFDFVDAVGDWGPDGALRVTARREVVHCTVYRPDIGGLLPLYVADRYEGVEARPFPDLTPGELDAYLERNVAAVAEVAERARPEVALANHLVMGPLILARALAGSAVPYAVKIHGSALEYTVKPHPRFLPYAREGIAPARGVLVGSLHTAESLWAALDDDTVKARTRLGPPGVDIAAFGPREPEAAAAGLRALVERLASEEPAGGGAGGFDRDPAAAAAALGALEPGRDRIVAFVGKLIVSKGIDLLVAAWPLVLARVPTARLVVVGFGAWSAAAGDLVRALAGGDFAAARALAAAGRELEGGPRAPLHRLLAFLDGLEADPVARDSYVTAAASLPDQLVFAGRLEHDELVDLLPACEAMVVPSTFPEAFGMVAAEAAATGALPVSADHSGLAEVTRVLAAAVPAPVRPWLGFSTDDGAVEELAVHLVEWLNAPADLRAATREALVATARERYSWEGVANGVIAAAEGRLDELPRP